MGMESVAIVVFTAMLAIPVLVDRYLRQLPVAPGCPRCRSVARQRDQLQSLLEWLPAFGRTFLAECARCGWRGRMRWRWAPGGASNGRRG